MGVLCKDISKVFKDNEGLFDNKIEQGNKNCFWEREFKQQSTFFFLMITGDLLEKQMFLAVSSIEKV